MSEEQIKTETNVQKIEAEPNITILKCSQEQLPSSQAILALTKLQLEISAIDREIYERGHEIKIEYQVKHEMIFKKRYDIVAGDYQPTESECQDFVGSHVVKPIEKEPETPGVPSFWLTTLKSAKFVPEIQENDEPILEHLNDIRIIQKPLPELGFKLEFHFAPNDYFENAILTKEYFETSSYGNPLEFNPPQIFKSVGYEIKWKDGKAVQGPSFFDYFGVYITNTAPLSCKDFKMGYLLRDKFVPSAILYFSGEKNNMFLNYYPDDSENTEDTKNDDAAEAQKEVAEEAKEEDNENQ